MGQEGHEEHFVLRVLDSQLAERLRGWLRDEQQHLGQLGLGKLQLDFKGA